MTEYGFTVEVPEGYDEAVLRTRLALRGAGFSIITEAHVGEMLGRPGAERQYLIMGAYQARTVPKELGDGVKADVHVACNVVVHEQDGAALVAALDPQDDVDPTNDSQLLTAQTARAALQDVLEKVASR